MSHSLFLSLLVLGPQQLCGCNRLALASLRTSTKQQDQLVSISPKVDPVAGAAVYAALDNAASNAPTATEIPETHTRNGIINPLTTPRIEIEKPVSKTASRAT